MFLCLNFETSYSDFLGLMPHNFILFFYLRCVIGIFCFETKILVLLW
jgi:hypothetical protein